MSSAAQEPSVSVHPGKHKHKQFRLHKSTIFAHAADFSQFYSSCY
jgi:hypothetical protein